MTPPIASSEVLKSIEMLVDRAATDREFLLQTLPISDEFANRRVAPFGSLKSLAVADYAIRNTGSDQANLGLELLQLLQVVSKETETSKLLKRILDATSEEALRYANTMPTLIVQLDVKSRSVGRIWSS